MEDGHHEVLTLADGDSRLILLYFQESEPDSVVKAFSLCVREPQEDTWYVGIAEVEQELEDVDERILDILIREGKYRDHWLQLRRAMVTYMEDNQLVS